MRVRQSIMMEFWLSFSFINFLIINLFKFVCYFMCVYMFGRFTFLDRYFYSYSMFVSLLRILLSLFISITIIFTIVSIITVIIKYIIHQLSLL